MSIAPSRVRFFCTTYRYIIHNPPRRQLSTVARDPSIPARTRFAPSPTGNLHLGSLRTALFSYLWAKRTGGQFVLRIEDTDVKRTVPGAEARILHDLKWAGLQWDEGPEVGGPYGPYRQSDRVNQDESSGGNIYKTHAAQLVETRHAYRCFCSPEVLKAKAEQTAQLGQQFAGSYDGTCLSISDSESSRRAEQGESYVIRMKDLAPAPTSHYDASEPVTMGNPSQLVRNDYVVLKTDGWPTYHLASVLDDHLMNITHVIRGVEWLKSTPKHLAIYNAFNWTPPYFVHVGLLRDEQQSKLSKRNLNSDLGELQRTILPEALMNFLALHGWKQRGPRSDVMTMDEMIHKFTLDLSNTNPIVTFAKLPVLTSKHAKARRGQLYQDMLTIAVNSAKLQVSKEDMAAVGIKDEKDLRNRLDLVLKESASFTSASEWIANRIFLLSDQTPDRIKAPSPTVNACRHMLKCNPSATAKLQELVRTEFKETLVSSFGRGQQFNHKSIQSWLPEPTRSIAQKIETGFTGDAEFRIRMTKAFIHMFLRAWISWGYPGESVSVTMAALGYDICIKRITENQVGAVELGGQVIWEAASAKEKEASKTVI